MVRLLVFNERSTDIWIEYQSATPANIPKIQKIPSGQSFTYVIPTKLIAARWWVKTGCNEGGLLCEFGNSVSYDTTQGAQPPLETKFEGTFGNGDLDYFDVSLVDGFSVPFRLQLKGDVRGSTLPENKIDCSSLSPYDCPMEKTLDVDGGLDLKYYEDSTTKSNPLACFSPCKKLNYSPGKIGQGLGYQERENEKTFFMCCPGPLAEKGESCEKPGSPQQMCPFLENQCLGVNKPDYEKMLDDGLTCRLDNFCGCCCTCSSTDKSMNPYPVVDTDYVRYCHSKCPVYAWAYDDYLGTITVPTHQSYDIEWTILDTSSTPLPTSTSFPEPTSTSFPEPTSTSFPEPTSTSFPEPTSTSFPEPTSTSFPISKDKGKARWWIWLLVFLLVVMIVIVIVVAIVLIVRPRRKSSKRGGG